MTLITEPFRHLRANKDKVSASQYNRLVDLVSGMARSLMTNGFIDSTGFHIRKVPLQTGTGSIVRKAYCKDDAGAATTITCYLDTDATGQEVTVNFSIAGGGNCNTAIPRLSDGDMVFITKYEGSWYCDTVLQISEDCDCYSAP